MSTSWDVIIAGGGFAGSTLAAALANGNRRVLLLEARSGPDPRFRGELIHPPGVSVLERLGLLGPLDRAGGFHVTGFAVIPAGDPDAVVLPYGEVEGGRPRGFAIDHREMIAVLRQEAAQRPGVEVRTGQRVAEILREGDRVVGVRTADGTEHRAALTVVAEGRHSKLRSAAGFREESRLLSWTAALLVKDTTLPQPGCGHVILGAPGPILAYPIGRNEVRMCIDVPSDLTKGRDAVVELLRTRYAPLVPEPLRSGMLASLDAEAPEMCANHAIYTSECVQPGLALLGDSAGCSHPLAASGMTVVLSDVRILAEELAQKATIDEALAAYQRRRYRFARGREVLSDALFEVFRAADAGNNALREGMYRYWRGSRRARAASVGVLSGHDERVVGFVAEYLRVFFGTTGHILLARGGGSLRERLGCLDLAVRSSWARMDRAFKILYQNMRPRTGTADGQRAAPPSRSAAPKASPGSERKAQRPEPESRAATPPAA
ncbi:MAG TPA: FAD-dependent monooxygenase [Polyangia bacterium]|jgi:2-polyprenyl-6-methoxyphenol hydroxylase-like FAD-dependent oxidoreductase|nr:FAD-dependent monooxygenase [Polyangia bacterium]